METPRGFMAWPRLKFETAAQMAVTLRPLCVALISASVGYLIDLRLLPILISEVFYGR
jgi:hypothetical protein